MKTVAVTRRVTEEKEVQIPLNEIKHTDIMSMKHTQLRSYAIAVRMLMKDTFNTGSNDTEHPQSVVEDQQPKIQHDPVSHDIWIPPLNTPKPASSIGKYRSTGTNTNLGKKTGKTCKYHLVHWNTKTKKYAAAIKRNGRSTFLGNHEDPRMAAMIVDGYLDGVEDTKRPRNRDEFPEIAKLYNPTTIKDL